MKKFLTSMALAIIATNALAEQTPSSQDTNQTPPSTTNTKDKSGFVLGIQINLASSSILQDITMTDSGSPILTSNTSNAFAFDGGLTLGYQKYFAESQSFGIRTSFYAGVGNPLNAKAKGFDGIIPPKELHYSFQSSYLPIKTGVDFDLLWDFFERGEHTLGMSVGVGYRFSYYLSLKNTKNVRGVESGVESDKAYDQAFSNLILHDFYPQIGLHYYYGNHQFGLNYRFGGLLKAVSKVKEDSIADKDTQMKWGSIQTKISNTNYLSMSYAYRF